LVGKVLEIDETTRFRHDYVRTRIACMDVTVLPRTTQSTLGLFIHEFVYEREVKVDQNKKMLKSGIRVGDKDHESSPKRSRNDDKSTQGLNTNLGDKCLGKFSRMGNDKDVNHSQSDKMAASAPPKMGSGSSKGYKLMSDAQKSFNRHVNDNDGEGRVQIPNNFEDSNTESETFSDKLKKINAYGGSG
jgi:hypothetical protein